MTGTHDYVQVPVDELRALTTLRWECGFATRAGRDKAQPILDALIARIPPPQWVFEDAAIQSRKDILATPPFVAEADLLTFEEAVQAVRPLLGTVIRPNIYMLRDGELLGCLAVDPDVAFAALQAEHIDGPTYPNADDLEAEGRGDPAVQDES